MSLCAHMQVLLCVYSLKREESKKISLGNQWVASFPRANYNQDELVVHVVE